MTPEIWMLLHEVGAFLQWAWMFSVAGLLLCFLWPLVGEEPIEEGDDRVLPERK